jgi:mRNA interferase ChpB
MERGDIYFVSRGAFNRLTKTPVVLPITSGGSFARTQGFAVPLMGVGISTTGVVRCDQPRALDIVARKGRKVESVSTVILDEVMAKLETILT